MVFSRIPVPFLLVLAHVIQNSHSTLAATVKVSFINFSEEPIKLFWLDSNQAEIHVQDVQPYEDDGEQNTRIGHTFCYYFKEERHTVTVQAADETHAMGSDTIEVACSTTTGDLTAVIKPGWSPRGAGRFLELVDMKYFDGCALNRVVKNFLTQFGISADYETRTKYRMENIKDDAPLGIAFEPGYMSYAGSGTNSRSTEVFIVMPDTNDRQLQNFGSENPWETPFGYVDEEYLGTVVDQWESYGDMAPYGAGPDPQLIYKEDGYEYLEREFPKMSYIHECRIVSTASEAEEL
jgi:peptidyl-prolyl cis-trans isomerase A (cyclophilin A)